MRQLILKDFAVQKRTAYIYLFMGLLFFFYFDAMDQRNMLAAMIPVFVIGYSFINRSMLEDERNHTIRMLLCLPVQRSVLVKAKYMSVALVILTATVVFSGIGAAVGLFSFDNRDELLMNLFIIAATMLSYSIIIAIFIPMVYKVGIVKAQTYNRFFFIGVMGVGVSFGSIVKFLKNRFGSGDGPPAWVEWIGAQAGELNPYAGLTLLFSLTVLVFIISMLLAIRFLDRREVF